MTDLALAEANLPVPDHVPPHLVADYDIWRDPTTPPDIQMAVVNKLHHQLPDIFYTPLNGGHWMVSRMDHLRKLVTDAATFSSVGASVLPDGASLPLPPQDMDAPEHIKYRKLLLQFLAPKDLSKQVPHVRTLCNELIDGLEGRNSSNFKEEIAVPLPVSIFMTIMDWDTSRLREFVSWTIDIISSNDEALFNAAMPKLQAFLSGEIARRQAAPSNDPLSLLLASSVDGEQLAPQRVQDMANLLFTAGLDTVTNAMTSSCTILRVTPNSRIGCAPTPRKSMLLWRSCCAAIPSLTWFAAWLVTSSSKGCRCERATRLSLAWPRPAMMIAGSITPSKWTCRAGAAPMWRSTPALTRASARRLHGPNCGFSWANGCAGCLTSGLRKASSRCSGAAPSWGWTGSKSLGDWSRQPVCSVDIQRNAAGDPIAALLYAGIRLNGTPLLLARASASDRTGERSGARHAGGR